MSQVYVSTYRKYNNGSLDGDWLDLSDYDDRDAFIEACLELHSDEEQPELMFQDWEDIPADFIDESHVDEKVWEWLALSGAEQCIVSIYRDEFDRNAPFQEALDCYEGEFDSEDDWAMDFWVHTGMLSEVPEFARNYIDYGHFARDARLGGEMSFVHQGHKVRAFRRY